MPHESVRPAPVRVATGILFITLVFLGSLAASNTSIAAGKGRWSPDQNWNLGGHKQRYAVHMILMPSDGNPFHSRILWFHGEQDTSATATPQVAFLGGQWGWTSGNEGCSAYPSGSFTNLSTTPPTTGMDPFCAGTTLIDEKLLVVGGTSPSVGLFGENKVRLFTPGTGTDYGTWSSPDTTRHWRWYPSTVALRDGRVATVAGQQHRSHGMFGGFLDGDAPASPAGDLVRRQQPVPFGGWDESNLPAIFGGTTRPAPRYAHTMTLKRGFGFNAEMLFGGRNSSGDPLNDLWRLARHVNHSGATPQYEWTEMDEDYLAGTPPAKRSDHTAILTTNESRPYIVFGGLGESNAPRNDVWRLFWSSGDSKLKWEQMDVSGTPPASRYGHTAIYDATLDTAGIMRERMIVFGGATTHDADPTDQNVYEFRFNPSNPNAGTWYEMTVVDLGSARPAPRFWHSMTADSGSLVNGKHSLGTTITNANVGLMFGGKSGSSAYSDSLWGLWIMKNGRVGWELRGTSTTGDAPTPRARHSAIYDEVSSQALFGRLYVYGGETASGPADSYVYTIDPWDNGPPSPDRNWKRWSDRGYTLSGHSAVLDAGVNNARTPEVYTPASEGWTEHTSATLHQSSYPPVFMVPGAGSGASRLINVHRDTSRTYRLDVPASGQSGEWVELDNGGTGFFAVTGVQYRPGEIMLAGGDAFGGYVTGRTLTLDTSNLNNSWVVTDTMEARVHHNLVSLPTGQVLVVGGNNAHAHAINNPVHRPQIWTPNSPGGGGTWTSMTGADTLAEQPTARTYHSTAVLLPDGRVLSAGGETPDDKYVANLYCPPYLFESDGSTLADRPSISGNPTSLDWGKIFTICVADTAHLTRAVLIRPGATTHSVDMNQRYVPLTFTKAGNPPRLLATSPASPDSAPAGYYMLFVTGSADGDDVPAIARWVRIGVSTQRDTCDTVAPATHSDLTGDYLSTNSIALLWTAPADDALLAASGKAKGFDLRYSLSAITNDVHWAAASAASGEPAPDEVGTEHGVNVTGLDACTWHYFQIRSDDDNTNLSGLHGEVKLKTLCGGGGGAGLRAARGGEATSARGPARGGEASSAGPLSRGTESATSLLPASGVLVAESSRDAETGVWTLVLSSASSPSQVAEADQGLALIQTRDASGTWQTRLRPGDEGDGQVGVPGLRDGRRIVFASGARLAHVASAIRGGEGTLALTAAASSVSGALSIENGIADLSLATGETVTLTYEPAGAGAPEPEELLLVAVQTGAGTSTLRRNTPDSPGALPVQFALHGARPNPATGNVNLGYDLPEAAVVRLEIFDLLGRRVRTVVDGWQAAGRLTATWDRRAASGRMLAAGVYVARLSTAAHRAETKIALVP